MGTFGFLQSGLKQTVFHSQVILLITSSVLPRAWDLRAIGSNIVIKTTLLANALRLLPKRSNIEQWHEKLPPLGKWKTFADAVQISRGLGIYYIWIDSLCIIQDSKEDWQMEYPQMCNVYKHSYCNLAATSALDDTVGCCSERDLDMDLPLRLCFGMTEDQPRGSTSSTITIPKDCEVSLRGQYDLCKQQTWINDITYSPLNSRGWVLQERLLSPRVLNFTKTQLYWECDRMQASESYPYGFPKESYANIQAKALNLFRLRGIHSREGSSPDFSGVSLLVKEAFHIWGNAVALYTTGNSYPDLVGEGSGFGKNLTNASDKLVAISAVAHELQPYMNCRYLAGHWETELVRQLAWTGSNGSHRPTSYRAPSWSWASVDAPIQDFRRMFPISPDSKEDFRSLVKILNAEVEPLTDDPMGQVVSRFLSLQAHLLELTAEKLPSTRYGGQVHEDKRLLFNGERTCLHIQLVDEESRPLVPWRIYCLPVSLSISHPTTDHAEILPSDFYMDFKSIVVQRAGPDFTYQRVGFLGANLGQNPTSLDFAHDRILRSVGTSDWSQKGEGLYSMNTTNLQRFKII
ncbi:heterokaryon incompatibility protein-domain-containing protein [Xylariales sp. AK1849]|nr:heterokaryon incompatibility protein-domain-containing protein [Xylariales sp. AK1849]